MNKWRSIKAGQIPEEDQDCLTRMKHGLISGIYDKDEGLWRGYYFNDISWNADKWIPVEEVGND